MMTSKKLFASKRGQIDTYVFVAVFLVIFAFTAIFGMMIWTEIFAVYQSSGEVPAEGITFGLKVTEAFKLFDTLVVLVMVILIIGVGVTSFKLRATPAGAIITVIAGIFAGFVSYMFNFIFIQLVSDSAFAGVLGFFPKTLIICTNLHWVTLIALVVGTITLYGKKPETINIQ